MRGSRLFSRRETDRNGRDVDSKRGARKHLGRYPIPLRTRPKMLAKRHSKKLLLPQLYWHRL